MNFILLLTDGLRQDFANNPEYTPNLHKFFEEYGGYTFTNTHTTSNWTGACVLSLQTGMLPSKNGMWDITYGRHVSRVEVQNVKAFSAVNCSDEDFLLAKMKKKGYTAKYIGDKRYWKFVRGAYAHFFDTNSFYDREYLQMKIWKNEKFEDPFFLFSYDLDGGHDPWGVFERDGNSGWNKWGEDYKKFYIKTKANMGLANFPTYEPDLAIRTNFVRHFKKMYTKSVLHKLFGSQVKQCDNKLGEFFKWFVDSGLYKNTAFYFFADHGESLHEHPRISGHAISLYNEEVKIPLFVYYPKGTEFAQNKLCKIDDNVSIVDIMATVLNKERVHDGINLFKRQKDRCLFFEFTRYKLDETIKNEYKVLPSPNDYMRGIRYNNYKLIYTRDLLGRILVDLYDFSKGNVEDETTRVNNPEMRKFLLDKLIDVFDINTENLSHAGRLEEVVNLANAGSK